VDIEAIAPSYRRFPWGCRHPAYARTAQLAPPPFSASLLWVSFFHDCFFVHDLPLSVLSAWYFGEAHVPLAHFQMRTSRRLAQESRGRCLFFIGEDQPVQHPDELDADNGLDQSRDARPSLVLIGILAKHERQIEASKPLYYAPASLGGLAAAQHSRRKCRSVDKIQGISRIRRTVNFGACTLQKYPQTARNKGLFLEHKDRAADKCRAIHGISSARGNAPLPISF
jgi:hypothetical protein